MSEPQTCKASLLIADDEVEVTRVLQDCLCGSYDCTAVGSAEEALALLDARAFDLIVSDITMDGMSGLEMVPLVLARSPETAIIMISGTQTIESAVEALRVGAFDYIMKPFDLNHVELIIRRALEHHRLLQSRRRYENYLEDLIEQRTRELNKALLTIEDSYRSTLKALAVALETRDRDTHGHSERVVSFSLRLGSELGLDEEQLRSLEFGALLHDIGKIGIADAVLRKPAPLTAEEWRQMREHPSLGQSILRGIKFLEGAARVVGEHHEKWDGSGYPRGLKGSAIDLNARVFAVADAFDAITSDRVYRAGKPYESAIAELETYAGRQFDPQVVAAFRRIPPGDWERLRAASLEKASSPQPASDSRKASPATLSSAVNALASPAAFSHHAT
ncbi:MAG: cyclic di-GMP phosphodiesterase [Blastocatellia bacterium]|jgi:putative nucleotidyltransferase with HDIG domain|nr:cyclic di-GMP phosphodiesterase [Blastocatellia bacterium]